MENKSQQIQSSRSNATLIIAIILAGWFIGMGIFGAGWLISKELVTSHKSSNDINQSSMGQGRINLSIPNGMQVLGSSDAKVTVIEFADYKCPYCKEWYDNIFSKLKEDYINTGKVRFVYWDFAFLTDDSIKAAEAASCAADQDKFWEYQDKLFSESENTKTSTAYETKLLQIAQDISLNTQEFSSCLNGNKYTEQIKIYLETATDAGVSSTPTVLINGYKFEGVRSWEQYKQVIDSQL